MGLRIGIFVVAALVLGAHFFRGADHWLVALCVAAPLLFLIRKRWSLILLQLLAYGAAAIWLQVVLQLVELRRQMGRPWIVAAAILGAVALYTLAAGLLLNSRAITRRYPA